MGCKVYLSRHDYCSIYDAHMSYADLHTAYPSARDIHILVKREKVSVVMICSIDVHQLGQLIHLWVSMNILLRWQVHTMLRSDIVVTI
jgi:hypothetical protein